MIKRELILVYTCDCGKQFTTQQKYAGHRSHCPIPRTPPRKAAIQSGKAKEYSLSEVLVQGSTYKTYALKVRLLKEGIKEHRCEECGLTTWNGKSIPLALHHKNGIRTDHQIENLQLLCCNCHAQTENYCGRKYKLQTTLSLS